MRPLFTRMYDLLRGMEQNRIEDYLTEIFSPILQREQWLGSFLTRFLDTNFTSVSHVSIFTQRTYAKLPHHSVDSRPDLVVSFQLHNQPHLLFIENKVGSHEGESQLSRYADHLKEHRKNGYVVHLLYITMHYDPKDALAILEPVNGSGFVQKRWFDVYNWLQTYRSDLYCEQVLEYMEELQLNRSRRFTPIDIFAIQNAQRLQTMLDETLDGQVTEKFTALFRKPKQWSHRTTQLRDHNLYILTNDQTDWKFVGAGFQFTEEEYPLLTVFLEVHPNCKNKTETFEALKTFCHGKDAWTFTPPSDDNDYAWLSIDKEMVAFLSEDDHIKAIQQYLIEKLEELHQLKIDNSELKWAIHSS
jgi:hypothetical protein